MNQKACILMGSPRKEGNTQAILQPFVEQLEQHGMECEVIWLYDKHVSGCTACRHCQKDWTMPYCAQKDDMQEIFDRVLQCDLLVLATPIYSWYCTAPMKAAMDRMVYALCKYYGEKRGPSLLRGKSLVLLATCGYRPEQGADLWEAGVKRYGKHTGMNYLGLHVERHLGYTIPFMDQEKRSRAQQFADQVVQKLQTRT